MMRQWKGQANANCLNQSKHTPSWCEILRAKLLHFSTCDSKVRMWWWLWTMSTNLNHVQSFIILMMRHWKGQANVICLNHQSKHTQSWCEKWEEANPQFVPTHDLKTGCGDHFTAHIPISTLSNHWPYLWWDNGRVKLMWIAWISPNILHLGVKCWWRNCCLLQPVTQKSGCGDGCGQWAPISTMSNHLSY